MQESDFVKGLADDGTPLTKAIVNYAQGHAAGYQKAVGDNIVISRQDHELLKVQLTAEKILNDLWKERNTIGQLMIFEEHLKEKAKEFGVEIKE